MVLERLAMWSERALFTEQGEAEQGFIGWLKGYFGAGGLLLTSSMEREADHALDMEFAELLRFLQEVDESHILRSFADLTAFCRDKHHDHIPYPFNRECFGFRILTEHHAWYIALTPWNPKRQVSIYIYQRYMLMTCLAAEKDLPEACYGILLYTGERILIRFGADAYEIFPQYGADRAENRKYAEEMNASQKLTVMQVAAMENGVIFGWDTPMADPKNYDEKGHFYMPEMEMKGGRR